jgi:hypothetical protein
VVAVAVMRLDYPLSARVDATETSEYAVED